MRELAGKRVLVLGLGRTGRSVVEFCRDHAAQVVGADERPREALSNLESIAANDLRIGEPFPDPAEFDLVVPSPGVPRERYAERAVRVWGDLEIAYRALSIPIVAVTGTNGKSTTCTLIEACLRAAGLRARAAGNIGTPALSLVGEPLDVAVLEVSSFQLETVEAFRPRVSVLLNLSPDHLDRHGSFDAYAAAKARIFATQGEGDSAVLNGDDPAVAALADRIPCPVRWFRRSAPVESGSWLDAHSILHRASGTTHRIALENLDTTFLRPLENPLAAIAAVAALGVGVDKAAEGLFGFRGLPHRMQHVATLRGVDYVNDSKATNPGAALRSLSSIDRPVIWIAGGADKGLDYDCLAEIAAARVRDAVLIGRATPLLEAALVGRIPTQRAESLEAAVASAAKMAKSGDVVLLSPACASFDQFRDFEDRGDCFARAVESIRPAGDGS